MNRVNDNRDLLNAFQSFLEDRGQLNMSLAGTGAVCGIEKRFVQLLELPHALAVANATVGLWAVFQALEIRDAEVITTPYTWGGTLAGLVQEGNRPVFADIYADSLCIDPESIIQRMTGRTKAIVAVDIYGWPCDGAALRHIADEYGLALVQDCAASFGAFRNQSHTGRWADAAVFSCGHGKALWAGEGGVIVTPHAELHEHLVWLTQHPVRQLRDCRGPSLNELAMNLRIHPLSAVWGDRVFDRAFRDVAARRARCRSILARLAGQGLIHLPSEAFENCEPAFHALTVDPMCRREELEAFLSREFPSVRAIDPPVSMPVYAQESYRQIAARRNWRKNHRCPVAETQCVTRLQLIGID